jgi:hypothetical protein
MTGGVAKAREISLGDDFGDVAVTVKVTGGRVEVRFDVRGETVKVLTESLAGGAKERASPQIGDATALPAVSDDGSPKVSKAPSIMTNVRQLFRRLACSSIFEVRRWPRPTTLPDDDDLAEAKAKAPLQIGEARYLLRGRSQHEPTIHGSNALTL